MSLLVLASAALAVPHNPRCDSTLTYDLLACGKAALDAADAKLNARWKVMRHTPERIRAQRAWLVWRDAECEAENYAIGGREEGIVRLLCLADLTEQRVKQLQEAFEGME